MGHFWDRAQKSCFTILGSSPLSITCMIMVRVQTQELLKKNTNQSRKQSLGCVETHARTLISFSLVPRIKGLNSSWAEVVKLHHEVSQKASPPKKNERCQRALCESLENK